LTDQQTMLGKAPIQIVDRIPTPEEVFKVPKLGLREKIIYLWGAGVIALGVSLGSGEFLLGPATAIKVGLGLAWLIWIGAILQTIYIYSFARVAIALGETPITTFFRIGIWAGWLGAIGVFLSFVWGGWAYSSAAALAGGFLGRPPTPADRAIVGIAGFTILAFVFILLSLGRRVGRTLEIFNWIDLGILFPVFIILALALTPWEAWVELGKGLVSVGYIPKGVDPILLGALWGYTGFATGINYVIVNWFKDKGWGMGSLTGYISGIIGGRKVPVSPFGATFKLTEENLRVYRRWARLVLEELFIVFCIGAIVGMLLPMTMAYGLARGYELTVAWGIPLWYAQALGSLFGGIGWWWGVIIALLVLVKTQIGVVDAIVRSFADAAWKHEGIRRFFKDDMRYLYYLLVIIILAWASLAFFFTAPVILILIAANAANFGALYGVPFLIYINYKLLPKELRLHWSLIVLNIIFGIICATFLALSIGRTLGII